MRAVWSGNIGFGVISIPVKLYTVHDKQPIKLTRISKCCGMPVGYKNYCKGCNKELTEEDYGKGFEVAKDNYVKLTKEQLESIKIPSEETIKIETFVPLSEFSMLWETGEKYYVSIAEKKKVNYAGRKAFTLFKQVLGIKNLIAIGKLCMRNKETLVAIQPLNNGLTLTKLYYASQIRENTVQFDEPELTKNEIELGLRLLEKMLVSFRHVDYKDGYVEALTKLIEGKETTEVFREEKETTGDLLEQLKTSIDEYEAVANVST